MTRNFVLMCASSKEKRSSFGSAALAHKGNKETRKRSRTRGNAGLERRWVFTALPHDWIDPETTAWIWEHNTDAMRITELDLDSLLCLSCAAVFRCPRVRAW